MDYFDLAGKKALVTGASSGIGAACAISLAEKGTWVICSDINSSEKTVSIIKNKGGKANSIICDVTNEKSVINQFNQIENSMGNISILVHCAGIIHEAPLLETSIEDFDKIISTNLRGSFLVGREAIRMMVNQKIKGRIILTASDLAYSGRETFSSYVASKHAVLGLVRSWAKEFAPSILVNAICPGPIDTPMLSIKNMSKEWKDRELNIPLARFGKADEIANFVVFLASDRAKYITGQGLGLNGGSVMA